MRRFFINSIHDPSDRVMLTGPDVRHIRTVLRLGRGDERAIVSDPHATWAEHPLVSLTCCGGDLGRSVVAQQRSGVESSERCVRLGPQGRWHQRLSTLAWFATWGDLKPHALGAATIDQRSSANDACKA